MPSWVSNFSSHSQIKHILWGGFIHLWAATCLPLRCFFIDVFVHPSSWAPSHTFTRNCFHSSLLFFLPFFPPPSAVSFVHSFQTHTESLTFSLVILPLSTFPSPFSFRCMAVYSAFVETASLLEDSPGINLPCLCQATDQQFTGHQLLGLLGARLTGVLGVWHDRAVTAGIVPALDAKSATYQQYLCSTIYVYFQHQFYSTCSAPPACWHVALLVLVLFYVFKLCSRVRPCYCQGATNHHPLLLQWF